MCHKKTGLTEFLGYHDGTSSVICHPLFSLSPGPSWRASSVSPCPHRETHTLKYDGWAEYAAKPPSLGAWLHLHLQHYQWALWGSWIPVVSLSWPGYEQKDRCRALMAPFTLAHLPAALKCKWTQQEKDMLKRINMFLLAREWKVENDESW